MDNNQTDQVVVAPVVDSQAPQIDTVTEAPVVDSQAGPVVGQVAPEITVENPVTPPVGQDVVSVDNTVTPPVDNKEGNEFGTWEEQYKQLRPKLNDQADEAKAREEALKKELAERNEWIEKYSPVLEKAIGEKADPDIRAKLLGEVTTKMVQPADVEQIVGRALDQREATRVAKEKTAGAVAEQDKAYTAFMEANADIKGSPAKVNRLIQILQQNRLPLNELGLEAAKSKLARELPNQPNNTAQDQMLAEANRVGSGVANSGGVPPTDNFFDVNRFGY